MSIATLKRHPLSAAWGDMPQADFSELVNDIEANGQREPVVLFEGMVLDGWHRYRACRECSIEPKVREYNGKDAAGFVISLNAYRRHLSDTQRTAAILKSREWAPAGKPNMAPGATLATNEAIAAEAKVSPRTVRNVKRVLKDGAPELQAAVTAGQIEAKPAAAIAALPKAAQPAAVAKTIAPKVKAKASPEVFKVKKINAKNYPIADGKLIDGGITIIVKAEKLKPILEGLEEEGRKNMATMSPGAVAYLAHQLRKLFSVEVEA